MKLVIWTAAKEAAITSTFGVAIRSFKPDVPPHEFVPFRAGGPICQPQPEEVCLCSGSKTVDALVAEGILPKGRSINSLRETVFNAPSGGVYLVTYDPAIVDREPEKNDLIQWDVRLAERLARTGSTEPPIGEYNWVADLSPLIDRIKEEYAKTGRPVPVGFDTETMGFYPWYPDKDVVSASFTADEGTAYMVYTGPQEAPVPLDTNTPLYDQIVWLLTSPAVKLRLSNGKFDMIWVAEKWGIECTNFKFDNMLVGSLLDENRSNSLNLHAKLFTTMGGYDDKFNNTIDKGHMEKVHPDTLAPYMGGDSDATFRVSNVLQDQLMQDPDLARFYVKILHRAARAFEKIERRGVVIDEAEFAKLAKELRATIDEGYNEALAALPVKMRIKYREKIEAQLAKGKSPMLPSILQEYFFSPRGLDLTPKETTAKTGAPSMAKSHLRQFGDVPEAKTMVAALTKADIAAKTLSTFVDGFLKHRRPDGRLHPSYMLFHGEFSNASGGDDAGTVTGRTSAKDPAYQIIPKKTIYAKKIRKGYPAPKGKVVLSADYSQGELKVVACVSNEKTMIDAYQQGLDLHAVTGAKLGGVPLDEFLQWSTSEDSVLAARFNKYRGNAKPANFGLLYGMREAGFRAYAWANYGLVLSLDEAAAMRDAFFELYPGLLDYHDLQRKTVKMLGHVRSPLGRVRNLPTIHSWDREARSKAERQAINSPIQSCLSDMMLWAISILEEEYGDKGLEIIGMIHDALVAYVPEEEAMMWAQRISDVMSNLPFHEIGWDPVLKFTADVEIGETLADLEKVKLMA